MPTENRSSNTEMISFPRELSDELAELIAEKARVCGGGAFEIWELICERFGKPVDDQADLDFMDPRCAKLVSDGRAQGLNEASELCARMGYDAYFPTGTRYRAFVPKGRAALGDLLIKAANAIADLPDGPYERFKARQSKQKS
ncbi:hypothetical protein KSS93_15170 [Pseudomonas xanthosomatis]|uniref:hypothetical protein n=1 Tax=Pseudomonas xanthosomatis TaxID=2842356 RepID=UPI001C3E34A9|nr:hypothetical protein [Pseudomonas xanthosomatis]QXH44237.1 hypothetical protein KSS93_15170 [Pseudomonas xanthosomatis]